MKTMVHRRGPSPAGVLKPLVVAMACAGVLPVLAQTASGLPEGLNVPTGGGVLSLSGDANTMTITQSTQRAVGDWNESPRVF